MTSIHLSADHPLHQIQKIGLAVGVVALAGCGVGWLMSPEQFFRSYLVAYLFGNMGAFLVVEAVGQSEGSEAMAALDAKVARV